MLTSAQLSRTSRLSVCARARSGVDKPDDCGLNRIVRSLGRSHAVLVLASMLQAFAAATASQVPNRAQAGYAKSGTTAASSVLPSQPKTESSVNPLGIDLEQPRLSWILGQRLPKDRAVSQTAYRVLVASSSRLLNAERGDLWDSGKVSSSRTINVLYQGKPLSSCQTYFWKVAIWDQDGRQSGWSQAASWTTGLLRPDEWAAHWVAAAPDGPPTSQPREHTGALGDYPPPLPIFRRAFHLEKPIEQAIVLISGLGQYELHINGADVTDSVMNPGWTDYRKTILYNTWDVTKLLKSGDNALGLMLGNGMYNVEGTKGRYTKFIGSFGQPKFLLQLQIKFSDGTTLIIVSDKSWKTAPGPITFTSIYGGEDYDATREHNGWDRPGFPDQGWQQALELEGPGGKLSPQMIAPLKVIQVFKPESVSTPKPGTLVYDLGQNFSGRPEIRVRGPRGALLQLTPGELLDKNGLVSQHSIGGRPGSAILFNYRLRGRGIERWHPRFSYSGFRYVQVSGAVRTASTNLPNLISLEGQFIHSSAPRVGTFSTSNQLFARIHRLIDMAIASNMVSVLTDCPHREKLGWLEETHLMGSSVLFNYDLSHLYAKMVHDMHDSQLADGMVPSTAPEYVAFVDGEGKDTMFRDSPEWGSAVILSPWIAYQHYGDLKPLRDNYSVMTAYVRYLGHRMRDGLLTFGLGDWYDIGPGPPGKSQLTQDGMTATATYFEDLSALAEIAKLLGQESDAEAFEDEARSVRDSINKHFLHLPNGQYDLDSQTANAMPLALHLIPESVESSVLNSLVEDIRSRKNHVTAGDVGFHYVVRALTDYNQSQVLSDMLMRTDSPSYGYQLQKGATSLTEAWDSDPIFSQNHFMLGHAEEWFYRGLAGIDFDMSRGESEQIVIHPSFVNGTAEVSATYDSVLGAISSSWSNVGDRVKLDVTIPPGASASIYIPTPAEDRVLESGRPVRDARGLESVEVKGELVKCVVKSGAYHFSIAKPSKE